MFPDQESARSYLEGRLWPNGPRCPVCGRGERITARKNGFYRCNPCKTDFTVLAGTIFKRSHIPLHRLLYAMYFLLPARRHITSRQLAEKIGITQKSAWFVRHRLREPLRGRPESLDELVAALALTTPQYPPPFDQNPFHAPPRANRDQLPRNTPDARHWPPLGQETTSKLGRTNPSLPHSSEPITPPGPLSHPGQPPALLKR